MKNYKHPGKLITATLVGAQVSGVPVQGGLKALIPAGSYIANESGEYATGGVFELKDDGTNHAQFAQVDWSIAGAEVVATTTGDFPLGYVSKTGVAGKVEVMLNGDSY